MLSIRTSGGRGFASFFCAYSVALVLTKYRYRLLIASVVAGATLAMAQGTYMEPGVFLQESFPDGVPEPDVVWLIGDIETDVDQIMGHPLGELRVRYWHKDHRSAWILEEIGKEEPITTGIVVHQGKIEHIQVLIYRESRGWEVRHDFFTRQFEGAELRSDGELDRTIDNISGATLSVRALTKLARLALYLDKQVSR